MSQNFIGHSEDLVEKVAGPTIEFILTYQNPKSMEELTMHPAPVDGGCRPRLCRWQLAAVALVSLVTGTMLSELVHMQADRALSSVRSLHHSASNSADSEFNQLNKPASQSHRLDVRIGGVERRLDEIAPAVQSVAPPPAKPAAAKPAVPAVLKASSMPSTYTSNAGSRDSSSANSVPIDSFLYRAPMCVPGEWEGVAVTAPRFHPIPAFEMVVGTRDNPCHFLNCKQFSAGLMEYPERFVIEGLAAILGDCGFRKCHALDFGGNLGYVNSYAAALGARVVSIEPQGDLSTANAATIKHNCWHHRVTNLHGLVELDAKKAGVSTTAKGFWRPAVKIGAPGSKSKPETVMRHYIGDVVDLLGAPDNNVDFIKIDVDSIDLSILEWFLVKMKQGLVNVNTILIETKGSGPLFFSAQQLGMDIYQMDHHLVTRFFDSTGQDVYKFRGCPIPGMPGQEYFGRRGIQYMLKMSKATNKAHMSNIIKSALNHQLRGDKLRGVGTSWLLTKEKMETPAPMERWSKTWPVPNSGTYNFVQAGKKEAVNPAPLCKFPEP